jgi:hypothetical protein
MISRVVAALALAFGITLCATCAPRARSTSLPMESVTLDASPCYGTCPGYRLTVSTDGNVSFEGRAYAVKHAHSQVAPELVRALIQRFADAQFAGLDSNYGQGSPHCGTFAMDGPAFTLILNANKASHVVRFYGSCWPDRESPQAEQDRNAYHVLSSLAAALDSIANTRQWYRQPSR